MAINTSAIQSLLRPGLAAVFGDYPQYPSQWSEIFERHSSDKAVEIEVEVKQTISISKIDPGTVLYKYETYNLPVLQ